MNIVRTKGGKMHYDSVCSNHVYTTRSEAMRDMNKTRAQAGFTLSCSISIYLPHHLTHYSSPSHTLSHVYVCVCVCVRVCMCVCMYAYMCASVCVSVGIYFNNVRVFLAKKKGPRVYNGERDKSPERCRVISTKTTVRRKKRCVKTAAALFDGEDVKTNKRT